MKTRHQEGYVYKKNGHWFVRFRQLEALPNGQVVRKQRARKLASIEECRSRKAAEDLRDKLFAKLRLNSPDYNPQSVMRLSDFAEKYFFPSYVEKKLKPSVRDPYESNWRNHLKPIKPICMGIRLRDFRPYDGQRVIDELVEKGLSKNTLKRVKSLLGGMFSVAIRQGVLDGANPMREVRIQIPQTNVPKACKETGVYTLGEVLAMLRILPEPSRTVVGVAGFSGLRKGEIRALRLENWDDGAIWVEQSAWRGHFSEPKTKASAAPVPVIAPLEQLLEEHRRGRTSGLLFTSRRGTPLNLDNLAKREIRPVLAKAGMEWRGWHAFRRGLATNLKQLGIDDKSIQAIMRHSDYQVTMNAYVKAVPESVQKAMSAFESAVCTKSAPEPEVRVV